MTLFSTFVAEDNALRGIRGEVKEIAVGPSHIAILLKDGRLARLPFSVISDRYVIQVYI